MARGTSEATAGDPSSEVKERTPWEEVFLAVAESVARRSTCNGTNVGAVITSRYHIVLSTGYNGAPRGFPHCTEVGCIRDWNGKCQRVVHAEVNSIIGAAVEGIKVRGGTLYTTRLPCVSCCYIIIQARLAQVICRLELPRDISRFNDRAELLTKGGVKLASWDGEQVGH